MRYRPPLPGRPHHPGVSERAPDIGLPPPGPPAADIDRAARDFEAKQKALARAMLAQPVDAVIDRTDIIRNPSVNANLVAFTVPEGTVARFNRLAVVYSEPLVANAVAVGWRVTINGNQVPRITFDFDGFGPFSYTSFGSVTAPVDIEPLFVQSGATVAIEIIPVAFGFALTLIGRLTGWLYSPQTPIVGPL